ncbi:hypothetical protein PH213_20520 [Streptomyces sp. SRF1]|nr:hypothetical protein [Streptomyces sp. SRF1]MDN3056892.1 hypothetical protein [Streptomyces sp. SRF1]
MNLPTTTPVHKDANASAAELLDRAAADRAQQRADETARAEREQETRL